MPCSVLTLTDPALVEAAAFAAGYRWRPIRERVERGSPALWILDLSGRHIHTNWNPLDDGNAALDLQARLHINLRHLSYLTPAWEIQSGFDDAWFPGVPVEGDAAAASRRAIVLAAAETGVYLGRANPALYENWLQAHPVAG